MNGFLAKPLKFIEHEQVLLSVLKTSLPIKTKTAAETPAFDRTKKIFCSGEPD